MVNVGSDCIWGWEQFDHKPIRFLHFFKNLKKRRVFLMYKDVSICQVNARGIHPVSASEGGTWYLMTWKFLDVDHRVHSSYIRKAMKRKPFNTKGHDAVLSD